MAGPRESSRGHGGGVVTRPGRGPVPIDPWGPLLVERLAPEKRDVLLGLAVTELSSLAGNESSRRELNKTGFGLIQRAVEGAGREDLAKNSDGSVYFRGGETAMAQSLAQACRSNLITNVERRRSEMTTFVLLIYFAFAVAHPVSEILERTSLRVFLNKKYYQTNREDFPVSKRAGLGGSLFVLAILIAPFLVRLLYPDAEAVSWFVVLGLVLADSIQHMIHLGSRPREAAPRVHLVTILGVLFSLLWIIFHLKRDMLGLDESLLLMPGMLIIFWNWHMNSANVRGQAALVAPVK